MTTPAVPEQLLVSAPLSLERDSLAGVEAAARRVEAEGLDGVSFSEMAADPMLHMTLAAAATQRLNLLTNIVVAFARSPMVLAMQARNIHEFSGGRLTLGIGSQVKPHIERRFSMPWSSPAARMAEYIAALNAIWDCWATGDKLDFRGDFYQHTLMSPMFTPVSTLPRPKVYLAAVGEHMTKTAALAADGLLVHPFSTAQYLREVTLPTLERARAADSRPASARRPFDVVHTPFVITGRTAAEYQRSREKVRAQIAFYGSTPAYRPVLEFHGWEQLADELNRMSTSRDPERWTRMTALVDDAVLEAFAVSGEVDDIGRHVVSRFGDVVTRIEVNHIGLPDQELILAVAGKIKSFGTQ